MEILSRYNGREKDVYRILKVEVLNPAQKFIDHIERKIDVI